VLRCVAPDAVFDHPFFVIRGQAAFHWIYEGWSLLNRRRVTYDATMSGACVSGAAVLHAPTLGHQASRQWTALGSCFSCNAAMRALCLPVSLANWVTGRFVSSARRGRVLRIDK